MRASYDNELNNWLVYQLNISLGPKKASLSFIDVKQKYICLINSISA
jgi:hypothetical protein